MFWRETFRIVTVPLYAAKTRPFLAYDKAKAKESWSKSLYKKGRGQK